MKHRHRFQSATFSRFTYCDYCSAFIWGLKSQGLQCTECGYTCHYGCKDKAIATTRVSSSSNKTPAECALLKIKDDQADIKKRHDSRQDDDRADAKRALSTADVIKDLVIAASAEADEKAAKGMPVSEYLQHQPPLNPQTTAKNFSRFLGRCGPVYALRDSIILLISWENPLDTWIAILVYSLVCIYPKLLLVIPQLAISFLLRHDPSKEENQVSKETTHASSTSKQQPTKSTSSNTRTQPTTSDQPDLDTNINDASGSSSGGGVFANALNMGIPLLAISGNTSPEYRKNLQNIQNTMGEFSDMHDLFTNYAQHWSRSDTSLAQLRRLLVGSALVTFILVSIIPLNYIFLSAGLAVFFANTRFAKALMHVIQQDRHFFNKIISTLDSLQPDTSDSDSTTTRLVSIFENQQSYDGGKHFVSELEPWDKRSTWSNMSGSLLFSSPCKMLPPPGFQWQEGSEWVVDKDGPWQEPYLGIEVNTVKVMVHPGEEGWIYTDQSWKNAQKTPNQSLSTRRRRWTRKCIPNNIQPSRDDQSHVCNDFDSMFL